MQKNKIIVGILVLALIFIMVGCSSFWTKPIPTAQPTETPIIPTTTPFAAPTPTPTISPTPTVNPTPTPIPTFIPTPVPTQNIRELFPRVTKSPTSEVVKEGGSCYFIANYENATIAVWHFVSPDGQIDMTYTGAQEFFAPVEIIDGMYSTMQLKNIPYSLDGWKVYCRYSNNYGSINTNSATITVLPNPTPVPTSPPTPTVAPTPIIIPEPTSTPNPTPVPTPKPTPIPTPEPTQTPEPTEVPSPVYVPDEKDIFYEDALNYVKDILKAQDEIIEEHKDDEEEFKLENYLIDYDFDTDTFTLYLTYDITEELFKEIQDNMIKENEEDNITLPESIIEIMEFNFDDIQYVEHIELTLQHDEDIEFCVVDLITNEIISLDGKPYDE